MGSVRNQHLISALINEKLRVYYCIISAPLSKVLPNVLIWPQFPDGLVAYPRV